MASVVNSFGIVGIDGYMVKIETDTIYGQPSVSIVGMGDTEIKESRDRGEEAIINSKFEFPKMKIVINLSPSGIRKRGAHFDLGMAVSLLAQSGQVLVSEIESYGLIGELSLNGDLRPCTGVLPMVIEVRRNGIRNMVVLMENAGETSLVKDINVFAFNKLRKVTDYL